MTRFVLLGTAIAVMALLIFARLGHYAFWDDEAVSGLDAKGILRTGDTSVLMDHGNIVAYRNGAIIQNFRDRVDPPLPNYVTAASFLVFGLNAWAGRLPFALCGLAAAALFLYWASRGSLPFFVAAIFGLCGNVSLILYDRQCRYYALCVLLSTAIVFIYWRWKPTPRWLLLLAGLSTILFASNYLNYLALYFCLFIDYVIWQRKKWPPTWRMAILLFGPQLVLNGIVGFIWNPMRTQHGDSLFGNSFGDRLTLFYWYWRDTNQCEFFALPLLLVALGLGIAQRRAWLVRGCVALALYLVVITLISPQPVNRTSVADLRYVVSLIPLAIALQAGVLDLLCQRRLIVAVIAALVIFGANLFNGGFLFPGGLRSTFCDYVGELIHPPSDPYTLTSNWINEHVPDGGSVWVLPDYSTYPLMFHAPRALYAWQLQWPPRSDFAGLPKIHFMGQEPPDYLIAFGPLLGETVQVIRSWNRPDVTYAPQARIDFFWKDVYRPELFWRSFKPVTGYDPNSQAIYIFKRNGAAYK